MFVFINYRLNNSVTPLWKQPYEDQLEIKQNNTMEFLRHLTKMLQKNVGDITPWLAQQRFVPHFFVEVSWPSS